MNKLSEAKRDFKKEWKTWQFKLFLTSAVILLISFSFLKYSVQNKYIFLIAIGLWTVAFAFTEIINKDKWNKKNIFEKIYSSYLFVLNIIFLLLYLVLSFGGIKLTIFFFLGAIGAIFLASSVYSLFILFVSRSKIIFMIATYLFMAFSTIVFFGYIIAICSGLEGNGVFTLDKVEVNTAGDFIYFSSGAFYSLTFGDLIPQGNTIRLLTQIEVALSAVIHVIILGYFFSKKDSEIRK